MAEVNRKKKLSEIGRYQKTTADVFDTQEGMLTELDEKTFMYTAAERREFAEALIDKWEQHAIDLGYGRDYRITPEIFKDFLKNEGL